MTNIQAGQKATRFRTVAARFPLVPRARPPARSLQRRIDELRELARAAHLQSDEVQITRASEVLNKVALIASDCGLTDLARQLCWRQFHIFHAAEPLDARTGKLALQPIVNLGRLATRCGDGDQAYATFQDLNDAVTSQTTSNIDGNAIDFHHFVACPENLQELRKFLWTVLLADGTRALTSAGRWDEALCHLRRYKGIGVRMLDGRQVAILAHCTTDDVDGALHMLDTSFTPEPWEKTVAACLRTLCLRMADRRFEPAAESAVNAYLSLEPQPEHLVFRTRLGLCVLDLAAEARQVDISLVAGKVIREAVVGADANSARDVLGHRSCRSIMSATDALALHQIVALSGLRSGNMPAALLDDVMVTARAGEALLSRTLQVKLLPRLTGRRCHTSRLS